MPTKLAIIIGILTAVAVNHPDAKAEPAAEELILQAGILAEDSERSGSTKASNDYLLQIPPHVSAVQRLDELKKQAWLWRSREAPHLTGHSLSGDVWPLPKRRYLSSRLGVSAPPDSLPGPPALPTWDRLRKYFE